MTIEHTVHCAVSVSESASAYGSTVYGPRAVRVSISEWRHPMSSAP